MAAARRAGGNTNQPIRAVSTTGVPSQCATIRPTGLRPKVLGLGLTGVARLRRRFPPTLGLALAGSGLGILMLAGTQHLSASPGGLSALAAPPACAQTGSLFLAPTAFDPQMVVTAQFGNPSVMGHSGSGREHTVGNLRFLWFEAINEQVQGIPTTFGPRDPSPLAAESPDRVFQVVETAQTFSTVADAMQFVTMFEPNPTQVAEVPVAGKLYRVQSSSSITNLGDEAIVIATPSPSTDYPASVQYVMRLGTTVVTLELVGGNHLTAVRTQVSAGRALAQVEGRCGL